MTQDPSLLESMAFGEGQIKLLKAASEILGGDEALARHLDVRKSLLAGLMSGRHKLPAPLLVQAIDIILQEREQRQPRPGSVRPPLPHRSCND